MRCLSAKKCLDEKHCVVICDTGIVFITHAIIRFLIGQLILAIVCIILVLVIDSSIVLTCILLF